MFAYAAHNNKRALRTMMTLHLVFSAEMSRGRVRLTGNQWKLDRARSSLVLPVSRETARDDRKRSVSDNPHRAEEAALTSCNSLTHRARNALAGRYLCN